jgi:hypothetical protein
MPHPIVGWRKGPPKVELTDADVERIMEGRPDAAEGTENDGPDYDPHWDDPEG